MVNDHWPFLFWDFKLICLIKFWYGVWQGSEKESKEGATEINTETVDTVDYRKPAAEGKESTKNDIHVVHLTKKGRDSAAQGLAGAAAAVAQTFQSANDAIFGGDKDNK